MPDPLIARAQHQARMVVQTGAAFVLGGPAVWAGQTYRAMQLREKAARRRARR